MTVAKPGHAKMWLNDQGNTAIRGEKYPKFKS